MFCHKCGARVDDQAAFCDKCGTALQSTLPAANAVTAARPEVSATPTTYAPATGVAAAFPATVQYAGFWRRLAAGLIDGLLLFAVYLAIAFVMGFTYGAITGNDEMSDDTANVIAYVAWIIAFLLGWLYWALMESSSKQATLGKMALGIVVTDGQSRRISFGRATGRYFGRILSALILYIGFIIIAFTEKKQGLHDIMADCLVVVKRQDYRPL
jgi:uncharacterized RDD family membrane protein YckC